MPRHRDDASPPVARLRPTLKDVAAAAGVSTAAVSQALNDRGALRPETRRRILEVAATLGYTPDRYAAALRRGRTMSIGYVASAPPASEREAAQAQYAMRQLTALCEAAAAHGFTVTVLPTSHPELLRSARVDAVYAPDARESDAVMSLAAAAHIPLITNDLPLLRSVGLWIRTGYEEATRAALDLLAAGGAARVGLLTEGPGVRRREIGEAVYRTWCAQRRQDTAIVYLEPDRRELAGSVRELLRQGADAVFSYAQEGPTLFVELSELGIVLPRDLQLVALCLHDCDINARLGVTHVCVHPEAAPRLLLPQLVTTIESNAVDDEEGTAPPVVLPWSIVGGSTTLATPAALPYAKAP